MSVNDWFVLGSNAKPILMSMQKDMPSSNVMAMRRTITNGTTTAAKIKRDEEKEEEENKIKYRRQTTEIHQIETRANNRMSADNNLTKKFAFLSSNAAPDYRPYSYGERIQNKQEKTNTNQSTKIQQLQSIFGQATTTTTTTITSSANDNEILLDNSSLINAENEVGIELSI
jgi:hypothetical protein